MAPDDGQRPPPLPPRSSRPSPVPSTGQGVVNYKGTMYQIPPPPPPQTTIRHQQPHAGVLYTAKDNKFDPSTVAEVTNETETVREQAPPIPPRPPGFKITTASSSSIRTDTLPGRGNINNESSILGQSFQRLSIHRAVADPELFAPSNSKALNRPDVPWSNVTSEHESSNSTEDLYHTAETRPFETASERYQSDKLSAKDGYDASRHQIPNNRLKQPFPASVDSFPKPVTVCVDTPMSFKTAWFWHPAAENFLICSRCYYNHIRPTQYCHAFQSRIFEDGKQRVCRFSKPRLKDQLFKIAVRTGSLQPVLDWMSRRALVRDCKGETSAKSNEGIEWYMAGSNAIPGLVACRACYEDHILCYDISSRFTRSHQQPAKEMWMCDFSTLYIRHEYEKRGLIHDFPGFASEAKARLALSPCPNGATVTTGRKAWYGPVSGPNNLHLCAACYCDRVLHSGEEAKWQEAPGLSRTRGNKVQCAMGQFNIKIARARAEDLKNFDSFWQAVWALDRGNVSPCMPSGIKDSVWYTLPGNPEEFGICEACYLTIMIPLQINSFFMQRMQVPTGATLLCCLNRSHARFGQFMTRILETYFTQDATSLSIFSAEWAAIAPCPRENEVKDRRWYGWDECKICPECFKSFAEPTAPNLVNSMTLRRIVKGEPTMCEMYSQRMRDLYSSCNAPGNYGANMRPLFNYSLQRRHVFYETIPEIKMIITNTKFMASQQNMLNTMSTHYMVSGQISQIHFGTPSTYSAPGVGTYGSLDELRGAQYGQQAMGVMQQASNSSNLMRVKELEQRWRAVE